VTEARIECLCADFKVPDLGLALVKGQIVWVDAEKARGSADLRHAKQIKAVSVSWRERCGVARNKVPVWVGKARVRELHQAKGGSPKPEVISPSPPARKPAVTAEPVRDLVHDLRQVVREEIRNALAAQPVQVPAQEIDLDKMIDTFVAPQVDDTAPVFIPKAVTLDDASIAVATQVASGEQVDAASSALKASKAGAKKPLQKKKE